MTWRILIVDDEPDVRMIIRTTLEPKYEVLEAHDGLDALEKIERYDPDFVIMDIMMPLMNGHEALDSIRKNPRFSDLPVMYLSALGSKDDIKKGFGHGANNYLTKPFEPSRLLKNIDVFFDSTPPPTKDRRYTIEELKRLEEEKEPIAPGAVDFRTRSQVAVETQKVSPVEPEEPEIPPRVMVVDDDLEIIEMIRLTLDGISEVVWATDGMQAIEKLVKYQPDILMIDIMLPKMNGFQLVQSLRSNRAFGRIPIMMCSAKGADRDKVFAKRVGANDYLVKPFSPNQLISKIKEMKQLPGFRIRPKTHPIEAIIDMEVPAQDKDVFKADDEGHRAEKQTKGVLGKFLAKESGKDALEDEPSPSSTKKRRFFGFGGKDE